MAVPPNSVTCAGRGLPECSFNMLFTTIPGAIIVITIKNIIALRGSPNGRIFFVRFKINLLKKYRYTLKKGV